MVPESIESEDHATNQQNTKGDYGTATQIKLFKRRWYIIFIYSLNCFLLSAEFIVYNAIPETVKKYYSEANITISEINLSLSICLKNKTIIFNNYYFFF